MSIKHWPNTERPREKLLQYGASALSDAELLAILLRHGLKGESALAMARRLINEFGGLRPLLNSAEEIFYAQKGLGPAKFAHLKAALELARRYYEKPLLRGSVLKYASDTEKFLLSTLRDLENEVFVCLFLDAQYRIIKYKTLFQGTLRYAPIYTREVVKQSLQHNAAAVIFAHNHPSGEATPSETDKDITLTLKKALEYIDVCVLDHMIIADNQIVSFTKLGLL